MKVRRSNVLVPASVRRMLQKAREFESDVVILDLEDTVPDTDASKTAARANALDALRAGGLRARDISVRVNGPRTRWFAEDIEQMVAAGVTSLTVPHTYGLADVLAVERSLRDISASPEVEILLPVETPATLLELEEIARQAQRVRALYVAPNDYSLETGSSALVTGLMSGQAGAMGDEQLSFLRLKVIAVARAFGWAAVDSVLVAEPKNAVMVREAMKRSRNLGFDGCMVLYPGQIEFANEVFTPSDAELSWAGDVIARYERMDTNREAGLRDPDVVLRQHYELAQRLRRLASAISQAPTGCENRKEQP